MVGIRSSTGCDICRQRKKKCGEERPECKACVSSGWKCPGYVRSYRYISENDKLSSHYRSRKYLFDSGANDPREWAQGKSPSKAVDRHLHVFSIIRAPRSSPAERAAAMLTHILTDPKCQSVLSPQASSGVLPFIPGRAGRNRALDAAIPCLYSIYGDVLSARGISVATTHRYIASLSVLRACIADPELRLESETICASVIVEICELMLDPDTVKYGVLLAGSRTLIHEAGPERFRSGLGRAMLELQRAPFIAQDLANKRPCFLSEPEWRALSEEPLDALDPASASLRLRAELCDFLVDVPDLVSQIHQLKGQPPGQAGAERSSLAARTRDLRCKIESWYEGNVLPHTFDKDSEVFCDLSHSCNRKYPTLLIAFLDCVTCSLLIKLDELQFGLENLHNCSDQDRPRGVSSVNISRQETAQSAYKFVQEHSEVTSKQLSFGLKNLEFALRPKKVTGSWYIQGIWS